MSDVCCSEPTESTAEGSFAGSSPSSSSRAGSRVSTSCGIAAYDLEQALGTGGSATVRLAWPKSGGPRCAIKALRKEEPLAQQLASNEARTMRLLDHPRVCKLLDVFEDDDNSYLVLEYIEGHDLFEEVAAKELMGERRAAEVTRQLLDALQHCHSRGVVHRDLKPENVMVAGGAELSVKLVDFGLAKREGQQLTGVAGTRPYLAPEALAGEGACSAALDMWSLGIVLYTCLLGELPPSSVRSGAEPVLQAGAWRKARVSPAARDLVARLLRPEASERPTAAEALQHRWLQAVPVAHGCSQPLGARGLPGPRKLSATRPAAKEGPQEQLLGWAFAAAPLEHVDALLGCMDVALDLLNESTSGSAAAAEQCFKWLGAAVVEASEEASAAPAFPFGDLFGGCCAAHEGEFIEVVETKAPPQPAVEKRKHCSDGPSPMAECSLPFGIEADTMIGL